LCDGWQVAAVVWNDRCRVGRPVLVPIAWWLYHRVY